MKKFFYFITVISFFSSCLKDAGFNDQVYGLKNATSNSNAVYFRWSYFGTDHSQTKGSIPFSTTPYSFKTIPVDLSSSNSLNKDLNVTLSFNDSIANDYVSTYLASNPKANYKVFDVSNLANKNFVVTIKKGSFSDSLKLTILDASKLDLTATYIFGFKITATDNPNVIIAENGKYITFDFNVANAYAGTYGASGVRYRYKGADASSPLIDSFLTTADATLVTRGLNNVSAPLADLGPSYTISLWIDPSDVDPNGMLAVNVGPDSTKGASTYSSLANDGDCLYDPVKKVFYLDYLYTITPGANGSYRHIHNILKRK